MRTEEKRNAFRQLHGSGCFVIPNPWDIGTARHLEKLGARALATTSAGLAFSLGIPDEALTRDQVLRHLHQIVPAVGVPVSADFQEGYGATAKEVAVSVSQAVQSGLAGLSIEDMRHGQEHSLFELEEAVERLQAALEITKANDVVLTARAECFLVGHPDPLKESIRRLQAYADAGADVLYAPGLSSATQIREVVDAMSPKPVNVLISTNLNLTVRDLAALGVRRISVGSALARTAWDSFARAAAEILKKGTFESFEPIVSYPDLNRSFQHV